MEHASCEDAMTAMIDIAEYDYLLHRSFDDRFVNNGNFRCDAAHPGSQQFFR